MEVLRSGNGKGTDARGGMKLDYPKGRDPKAKTATVDWIPETGKPREEGTTGGTSGARVVVTAMDSVMGSRSAKVCQCPRVGTESPCT